jgi:hypothetical protein
VAVGSRGRAEIPFEMMGSLELIDNADLIHR